MFAIYQYLASIFATFSIKVIRIFIIHRHDNHLPSKHTRSQERHYNVAATSRRCSDVVTTLLRCCVFAGLVNGAHDHSLFLFDRKYHMEFGKND